MHKNARLTPKGREDMVRAVVDHGHTNAEVARRFNTRRRQSLNGLPASAKRARPLLTTSFIAKPNGASHMPGDRGFAPAAPKRKFR